MAITSGTLKAPRESSGSGRSIVGYIVGVFLLSRVLFFLVATLPVILLHGVVIYGGGMHLFNQPWGQAALNAVYNADSGWYMSVARYGYVHMPFSAAHEENWAFFPLYPWIVRYGGLLFNGAYLAVGVIVSNIAYAVFLWWLYMYARDKWSNAVAEFSVLLAAFWILEPYAVAFRASALFMMLVMGFFLAMERRQWGWALVAGGLATLARPTGVFLVFPYGLAILQNFPAWPDRIKRILAGATFSVGGLVTMYLDWKASGNPLAFVDIEAAWARYRALPFRAIGHLVLHPYLTNQGGWNFGAAAALLVALGILATIILAHSRKDWTGTVYVGLTTLLSVSWSTLMGTARFITQAPQIYTALSLWATATPRRQQIVLISVVVLFSLYTVLWGLGIRGVQS